MGGHFDAVGFGDPTVGFEATRDYLRTAVQVGQRAAETGEIVYYALETSEGCGLVAATDGAGFLLNGCPYFHGREQQAVLIESLAAWDPAEPDQGGARGRLQISGASPTSEIAFALPSFAAAAAAGLSGRHSFNLVGLGYRASTHAGEASEPFFRPRCGATELPPIRRCNVDCRGRVVSARLFANSRSGARLAYALVDCGPLRLEVVIDLASLEGGLAEGAQLEGSFWLVGRPVAG